MPAYLSQSFLDESCPSCQLNCLTTCVQMLLEALSNLPFLRHSIAHSKNMANWVEPSMGASTRLSQRWYAKKSQNKRRNATASAYVDQKANPRAESDLLLGHC